MVARGLFHLIRLTQVRMKTATNYDKLSSSWTDIKLGMSSKIFLCGVRPWKKTALCKKTFFPHRPDCPLHESQPVGFKL